MLSAVEIFVDAIIAQTGKLSQDFATVAFGRHVAGHVFQLGGRDDLALRSGEMERSPIDGGEGAFIGVEEVIAALRRADEEGAAEAV